MRTQFSKIVFATLSFALALFLSCADNPPMEFPSEKEVWQRYPGYSSAEIFSSSSEAVISSSSAESSSSAKESSSSSIAESSSSSSAAESSSSSAESSSSMEATNSSSSVQSSSSSAQSSSSVQDSSSSSNGSALKECGSVWYNASNANLDCQNNVIVTKCGSGWYNASNANLDCQNNVIVTKCGSGWYNSATQDCCAGNTIYSRLTQRCQVGQSGYVVETKCGSNNWYDASNTNLICQGSMIMIECGSNALASYNSYDCCAGNTIYSKLSQRCQNDIVETKCGNGWYNSVTQFCYSNSKIGSICGINPQEYDPDLYECRTSTNPNGIYLKNYNAVLIGNQVWMAANTSSSSSQPYWAAAMNIDQSYNYTSFTASAKHQGICPSGWHIPSYAEWDALMQFVNSNCSSCDNAGTLLMATSSWNYSMCVEYDYVSHHCNSLVDKSGGTDDYGFSALTSSGKGTSWWSSTNVVENNGNPNYNSNSVYIFKIGMSRNNNGQEEEVFIELRSESKWYYDAKVRCLKD